MSSTNRGRAHAEAWVMLVFILGMTAWYANPQILYSLHFVYEVARLLLPGVIPPSGGS